MKVCRERVVLCGTQCCASVLYDRQYPTERRSNPSLTDRDVLQLFAKLLTLPGRHRLPSGVLHKIEPDTSRRIILARTGLPGGYSPHYNANPKKKKKAQNWPRIISLVLGLSFEGGRSPSGAGVGFREGRSYGSHGAWAAELASSRVPTPPKLRLVTLLSASHLGRYWWGCRRTKRLFLGLLRTHGESTVS